MRVLMSPSDVARVVRSLAQAVSAHHPDGVVVVPVLNGAIPLAADIMRALDVPVLGLGTVRASSYRGGTSAGELDVNLDGLGDVEGRVVLLVDEIADSGRTIDVVSAAIRARGARVRTLALLVRESCTFPVNYIGHRLADDAFVVGYGLDLDGRCREAPGIVALEPEDLAAGALVVARQIRRAFR